MWTINCLYCTEYVTVVILTMQENKLLLMSTEFNIIFWTNNNNITLFKFFFRFNCILICKCVNDVNLLSTARRVQVEENLPRTFVLIAPFDCKRANLYYHSATHLWTLCRKLIHKNRPQIYAPSQFPIWLRLCELLCCSELFSAYHFAWRLTSVTSLALANNLYNCGSSLSKSSCYQSAWK